MRIDGDIMDTNILNEAKDFFKKNVYPLFYLEGENYNQYENEIYSLYNSKESLGTDEIRKSMIKLGLDIAFKEMYFNISNENVYTLKDIRDMDSLLQKKISKNLYFFEIIMELISDNNLNNYYSKLIELIKKMNEGPLFGIFMIGDWSEYSSFYPHIIIQSRKEIDEFRKIVLFDTSFEYLGLLPKLYYDKEFDLFNELLEVLYDYIENFGFYGYKSLGLSNIHNIKLLYRFSSDINNETMKNRIISIIKSIREKYSCIPLSPFYSSFPIGEEFQLENDKIMFYEFILNSKKTNLEEVSKLLNIDASIIKTFDAQKDDFFLSILNNIDDYFNPTLSMHGIHNVNYQVYRKSLIFNIKSSILNRIIYYCIGKHLINNDIIDCINITLFKYNLSLYIIYDGLFKALIYEQWMNFKVDKYVVLRIYEGICNLTKDIESIRVLGTSLLYYAFERNDNEFKNEVNNLIKKGLSGVNYHLEKGFKIIIDK